MDIKDFENKVICGDCIEVMKTIEDKSIDMILMKLKDITLIEFIEMIREGLKQEEENY